MLLKFGFRDKPYNPRISSFTLKLPSRESPNESFALTEFALTSVALSSLSAGIIEPGNV